MECARMSSGGRPGRRKCALSSAALCATCCSRVYSCAPQPPLPEGAPLQRWLETSGLNGCHLLWRALRQECLAGLNKG